MFMFPSFVNRDSRSFSAWLLAICRQLVHVSNLRAKISRLQQEGEQLAKHGPARPPEDDEASEKLAELDLAEKEGGQTKVNSCPDPSERRTGTGTVTRHAFTRPHNGQTEVGIFRPVTVH